MEGLSVFEVNQLKVYREELRKTLRLTAVRELYTYNQAAFALNSSRNTFESEFIKTGLLKVTKLRGKNWIARTEIEKLIEEQNRFVHEDSLK
jgi:hypothetical protein